MTSEEDGILIEDVGLPPKIKPEKLPEGLNETLLTMDVGNSFSCRQTMISILPEKSVLCENASNGLESNTQNESTRSGRKTMVSGYTG